MISLETAKALKSAGLVWEPDIYDYFESMNGIEIAECFDLEDGKIVGINGWMLEFDHDLLFLPRLDQILTEIEKWGYGYTFKSPDEHIAIYRFWVDNRKGKSATIQADTPDEAAAQALIWILTEGAK